MQEILPSLYLGNITAADDTKTLLERGIKYILTAGADL
jgi:hypothetical protein